MSLLEQIEEKLEAVEAEIKAALVGEAQTVTPVVTATVTEVKAVEKEVVPPVIQWARAEAQARRNKA
jgi:hypothetical protein